MGRGDGDKVRDETDSWDVETQAKAIAEIQGIPDYPFAIVPHPIGRLAPEVLKGRAESAIPQILNILDVEG